MQAARARGTPAVFSLGSEKLTCKSAKSIKIKNLPYKDSVSDAEGHPVTVRGQGKSQSKSKPIRVTVNGVIPR